MKLVPAVFLALAIIAAQLLHGGFLVPALVIPSYGFLLLAALGTLFLILRGPIKPAPGAFAVVLVFVGYLAWRYLHAPDAYLGRIELGQLLAGGLAFLIACCGLPSLRSKEIFLGMLAVVALIQAVVGFFQFAKSDLWPMEWWFSLDLRALYSGKFMNRARGLFLNPNHFAWLQMAAALFAVALASWGRVTSITRVILIYLAMVFISAIVLSGSRGGIAALLCGLTAFFVASMGVMWATMQRGRVVATIGAITVLAISLGAGWFVYTSSWMSQARVDALQLQDVRELLYGEAFRLFQTSPLLGVGPEMFAYGARVYRLGRYWIENGDPIFVHNDWLQTLTESGIVGLALAAMAIAILLGGGLARFLAVAKDRAASDSRPISTSGAILLGAFSATVAFAVHSLVDFNMHIPANALLAGAILGLLAEKGGMPIGDQERLQVGILRALGGTAVAILMGGLSLYLWRYALGDQQNLLAANALAGGNVDLALRYTEKGLNASPLDAGLLANRGRALYAYESSLSLKGDAAAGDDWARDITAEPVAEDATPDEPDADEPDAADENTDSVAETEGAVLTPEERTKYFRGAADAFSAALTQQPLERRLEIELAKALAEVGNRKEAERRMIDAIRLDPAHGYAYGAYGDFLYEADQVPRALRIYSLGAATPGGDYSAERAQDMREELAPVPPDDAEAPAAESGAEQGSRKE